MFCSPTKKHNRATPSFPFCHIASKERGSIACGIMYFGITLAPRVLGTYEDSDGRAERHAPHLFLRQRRKRGLVLKLGFVTPSIAVAKVARGKVEAWAAAPCFHCLHSRARYCRPSPQWPGPHRLSANTDRKVIPTGLGVTRQVIGFGWRRRWHPDADRRRDGGQGECPARFRRSRNDAPHSIACVSNLPELPPLTRL